MCVSNATTYSETCSTVNMICLQRQPVLVYHLFPLLVEAIVVCVVAWDKRASQQFTCIVLLVHGPCQ